MTGLFINSESNADVEVDIGTQIAREKIRTTHKQPRKNQCCRRSFNPEIYEGMLKCFVNADVEVHIRKEDINEYMITLL